MKKLIVLRGNSGSGKTTVAKELQKRFGNNTMLLSQDVIRKDMQSIVAEIYHTILNEQEE